jgi:hypothetical protein
MTKDVYSETKKRNRNRTCCILLWLFSFVFLVVFGATFYHTGYNEVIGGGRTSDKKTVTVIGYKICGQKIAKDTQVKVSYLANSLLDITDECYINRCFSSKYVDDNYQIDKSVTISVDNDSDIECMTVDQASSIAINGFIMMLSSVICLMIMGYMYCRHEKENDSKDSSDKNSSDEGILTQQNDKQVEVNYCIEHQSSDV